MKPKVQAVTDLAQSPDEERRGRIIRYSIAMTVRMICIVLAMVLQGWMMWVCFAGAILLPYFAVVIANAQGAGKAGAKVAAVEAKPLEISADEFRVASDRD